MKKSAKRGLVEHAKRELKLLGEDPEYATGIVNVVQAFANMGHSGYSAMDAIDKINTLLKFKNLTPLTNDPDEWMYISEETWGFPRGVWQSRRDPEAFSHDGGNTYYLLSNRDEICQSLKKH